MTATHNLTLEPSTIVPPATPTPTTPSDPAKAHETLVLNIVIPIFVIIAFLLTLLLVFHWPSKQSEPESNGNLELRPVQSKASKGKQKRKRYGSINEACDDELEDIPEIK